MATPDDLVDRFQRMTRRFPLVRLLPRPAPVADLQRSYQTECEARLNQAWYAIRQFREHERLPADLPSDVIVEWTGSDFEQLRFYAEAFYYFAFRFQQMSRKLEVIYDSRTVKPFKKFECVGIRTARNQFMEHSDDANGIIARHFMTDTAGGYVFHPFARNKDGTRMDRGLYVNAEDFVSQIGARLTMIGIS